MAGKPQKGGAVLGAAHGDDANSATSYTLSLKIKYETQYGQHLCVVGSVPQLGNWKEYKYELAWTPGHFWVSKAPVAASVPLFQYKYVLMKDGKMERWERGVNRIADLRLLARRQRNGRQQDTGKVKSALNSKEDPSIALELEDEWERFRLRTTVVVPSVQQVHSVSCTGADGMTFQLTQGKSADWAQPKHGEPSI